MYHINASVMEMASLCMQILLEHLQAITYWNSEALMEEQSSSLVCSAPAGTSELSHELWGWEEQVDVKDVLSGVLCEQTEFLSAVQQKLHKIEQLL